jgi:hypothetical protein
VKTHWLRDFLYREDNFALVNEATGGGWLDGGCQILADALVQWLGEGAESYYLVAGSNGVRDFPEHALVRYGDVYLDGDGASSEGVLLARWEQEEHIEGGWLTLATDELRGTGWEGGIPSDDGVSYELAQRLKVEFPVIPWPKPLALELG